MDDADRTILGELAERGRATNRELSAMTGLSVSRCSERVTRLEREGLIGGYHADVAPELFGGNLQAIVALRLNHDSRSTIEDFLIYVRNLPEVLSVFYLTGPNDFLVHIAAQSPDHLSEIVLRRFTSRPAVQHLETSLVYRHERRWRVDLVEEGPG